jgi:alkanesulfonate monooxygenase SsuD/methylene tetrahydromethanopterin reductase-like flavin-dependent oxidoreductase (luciferase family)
MSGWPATTPICTVWRRGYVVMVTPRHYTAAMLAAARARFEAIHREVGADPAALRFDALRHVCVTGDRAEARDFLGHVRYQIRLLSQSLRHRKQAMEGGMLVEKPWPGEMSLDDMEHHMMVGDAHVIAERLAAEIRLTQPCHYLLQFQAGGSSTALALRSIERFATEVRPLLERGFGPLDRIGVPALAA